MALNLPKTAAEVVLRSKVDVQRELQQSDPFLKNHWLLAIITANGNRVFDFYLQLKQAMKALVPDTSFGEWLIRWAAIYGKSLLPATQSTGNLVATGAATYSIPSGTVCVLSTGTYTSTAAGTLSTNSISIAGLVRSGTTVTATTTSDHGLGNNVEVTISGAVETGYNVTNTQITVTAANTFTYTVDGSPTSPATGTILAGYVSVTIPVKSDAFGESQNLNSGATLTLQSPLAGISDTLAVDFGAIGGGTDAETETSLRTRMIDRIQNPVSHFNEAAIVDKAKEIAGVTRVFVESAGTILATTSVTSIVRTGNVATVTATAHGLDSGMDVTISGAVETAYNGTFVVIVESASVFHYIVAGTPTTPATGTILADSQVALGVVNVYFTRDNDDNLIPTGSEVNVVAAKLLEILPANTQTTDLNVAAPTAVPTDFVFSDLTPNTAGMRTAVTANLNQFFRENTIVGSDVDQDAYRAAIFNSVDIDTGVEVQTFTLSAPSADITVIAGEIGTLGNITY